MNTEFIMKELKKKGIDAEIVHALDNGVQRPGILIKKEGSACPVVRFTDGDTEESVIRTASNAFHSDTPPFADPEMFTNWEKVKDQLILCIQKDDGEDIVKRPIQNLSGYMRICVNIPGGGMASTKVTGRIVESCGVSEDEFWEAAYRNTRRAIKITKMKDIMGDLLPGGFPEEDIQGPDIYVVTTEGGNPAMYGASALDLPDLFEGLCRKERVKGCFLLPSSIHELVVLPENLVDGDCAWMAEMVNDINHSVVDPRERLEPAVYRYDLGSGSISMISAG